MTRFRLIAICVLVLAVSFVTSRILAADNAAMPQAGQTAPQFSLPSQDGSTVNLKDYQGKYVVLYFYPKDMTSGCTLEAHNFQRDLPKFQAANAVVLGVSADDVNSHKQFCTKDSLTFKLLADPDRKVVAEYGSEMMGMPMAQRNTFLIDPQGKVVKVWTKVDPSHHSEEVLAALDSMEKK